MTLGLASGNATQVGSATFVGDAATRAPASASMLGGCWPCLGCGKLFETVKTIVFPNHRFVSQDLFWGSLSPSPPHVPSPPFPQAKAGLVISLAL